VAPMERQDVDGGGSFVWWGYAGLFVLGAGVCSEARGLLDLFG